MRLPYPPARLSYRSVRVMLTGRLSEEKAHFFNMRRDEPGSVVVLNNAAERVGQVFALRRLPAAKKLDVVDAPLIVFFDEQQFVFPAFVTAAAFAVATACVAKLYLAGGAIVFAFTAVHLERGRAFKQGREQITVDQRRYRLFGSSVVFDFGFRGLAQQREQGLREERLQQFEFVGIGNAGCMRLQMLLD